MIDPYQEKIKNISELLIARSAVYPVRDNSFTQLNEEIENFSSYLLADIDFENFNCDRNIVKNAEEITNSPIFICGSMKSGTTLLTHLLDNHPDLLVMPGDSHFINQSNLWNRKQFSEIASHWIQRIINPTGQEPFWFFGKDKETFQFFLQYLYYFLSNSKNDIFVCVVMSFYAVNAKLSGVTEKKYWVEKTPHNELNAQNLNKKFPKAKFIHVLRDPLNNIVSLKKLYQLRGWKSTSLLHAQTIKNLFRAAKKNQEGLGNDKYLIVSYEHLTADPNNIMNKICSFLDIPFCETLLTPTENGQAAKSNSMFLNDRVTGTILNRGDGRRYINQLSHEELQDIVTTLYVDAIKAGYDWNIPEIECYRKTGLSYGIHKVKEFWKKIFTHP
jgi:hypothetical protein